MIPEGEGNVDTTAHRTGTVASGDVTLFYRLFGSPGATPILVHHGAQYYDSADWVGVAPALVHGRQVAVHDARGYANSTWSPSKDYSVDAAIGDSIAILDHLGWDKVIFMGHSRGGGYAILLAAHYPDRAAGLVIVDRPLHKPVGEAPHDGKPSVGRPQKVYATIGDAIADMSRDADLPEGSPARARLESFLRPVSGGYAITGRDPDYGNLVPVGREGWKTRYSQPDLWSDLALVRAPMLIVRGTKSDRYPPQSLVRLSKEFPQIEQVELDCGHDVPAGAPAGLIAAVNDFVGRRID
jgi:pimeloyl-ACP methyl ester carboxylesterase